MWDSLGCSKSLWTSCIGELLGAPTAARPPDVVLDVDDDVVCVDHANGV